MHITTDQLPSYRLPPIDEVAIAVQFQGIERFSLAYGAFFERVRDKFPSYEEHDPIPVQFETFGRSQETGSEISLESLSLRRGWYVSADGHELVQLQPNRLVQNWRKIEGKGEYPRFPAVFGRFQENFKVISEVLSDLGLAELSANQAEITYFNNILLLEGENHITAFERVFNWPQAASLTQEAGDFRLEPEGANLTVGFRVFAPGSEAPSARLVATAVPAETEAGKKIVRFQLRFRGPPGRDCSLEDFLQVGRAAIVRSFTDLTSPACHTIWGREK